MHLFTLAHDEARRRAVEAVRNAPAGYVIRISEPTRNLEQNALLHARLQELGEAIDWKWNGFTVDLDALKRLFMAAYRKQVGKPVRMLPGLDGEPVVIDWRTSAMTIRECSELIELINCWQAENVAEAA